MIGRAILMGLGVLLAGCAPRVQAISGEAIGQVQADIRRQVDIYVRASRLDPWYVQEGQPIPLSRDRADYHCGRGRLFYEIGLVRAELTVANATAIGGSVGAAIPVPPVTTIELGATGSSVRSNAQTLRYHLWPFRRGAATTPIDALPTATPTDFGDAATGRLLEDVARAPIAQALMNLRNQQVMSAMRRHPITNVENRVPETCFTNYDPADPLAAPENYYTLALTVKDEGNGKISVGVGPVSIGGSFSSSVSSGSTLTAFFHQPGLERVQVAVDLMNAACAKAARLSEGCLRARRVLNEEIEGNGPGLQGRRIPGVSGRPDNPGLFRADPPGVGALFIR